MTHRTKTAFAAYQAHPEIFEFMAAFSKFEYALKKSGRAKGGDNKVQPDWRKFQEEVHLAIDPILASAPIDSRAQSAQALLKTPPSVQFLKHDKTLGWRSPETKGETATDKLCWAVKAVRNNLFHGGKELRGNVQRDLELIRWALDVLDLLIEHDEKARAAFDEY